MANCTINDGLFAVKPIVFSSSASLTPEDIYIQELCTLQTLSRLGLALMFEDLPSLAFLAELHTPGYWHALNDHVETTLRILDAPASNAGRFSALIFQLGQMQALLVQGLEKLYPELPNPKGQLWYNYLSVMWSSVNSMLEVREGASSD